MPWRSNTHSHTPSHTHSLTLSRTHSHSHSLHVRCFYAVALEGGSLSLFNTMYLGDDMYQTTPIDPATLSAAQ